MNSPYHIARKIYLDYSWKMKTKSSYELYKQAFSKEYACLFLKAETASKNSKSKKEISAAYAERDQYILSYLKENTGGVFLKTCVSKCTGTRPEKPIWLFWWSGEATAPAIVKVCIRSIRENANGHPVIFIDEKNWNQYVALPDDIIRKHDAGLIGHAHFSDMIRLSLLSEYGGAWIDATVFLSQPIPNAVFEDRFYTIRSYQPDALWFSKSRWCGYFLAGDMDFPLFSMARDMLITYWMKHDVIIDYLLMDYIFYIIYENNKTVKQTIDSLPDNNLARGELMANINAPFDEALFSMLSTGETFASKLSWRYGKPTPITRRGKKTNYGHLLSMYPD